MKKCMRGLIKPENGGFPCGIDGLRVLATEAMQSEGYRVINERAKQQQGRLVVRMLNSQEEHRMTRRVQNSHEGTGGGQESSEWQDCARIADKCFVNVFRHLCCFPINTILAMLCHIRPFTTILVILRQFYICHGKIFYAGKNQSCSILHVL